MDLHPDCASLAFLLGTWKGSGAGEYPTIESFGYLEESTFSHVGKPFLAYGQKTRHATTGLPLHAETGYLRAVGGSKVEFLIAQPSGIVELHVGTVEAGELTLALEWVQTTPTAKSVTDVQRNFSVDGEVMTYTLAMAAVGQPLTHHLRAELHRSTD